MEQASVKEKLLSQKRWDITPHPGAQPIIQVCSHSLLMAQTTSQLRQGLGSSSGIYLGLDDSTDRGFFPGCLGKGQSSAWHTELWHLYPETLIRHFQDLLLSGATSR